MNKKLKIWIIISSLLLVCFIIGLVYYFTSRDEEAIQEQGEPNISEQKQDVDEKQFVNDLQGGQIIDIIPLDSKEYGIDIHTDFKLKTSEAVNLESISSGISMEPEKDYTIQQTSDKEYILSLGEPLDPNSIVRLSFTSQEETKGWAFQTQKPFAVASTFPGDNGYDVPVNTGIEIIFTKECTEDINDYLSITPPVKGSFQYQGNKIIFLPDEDLKMDTRYTINIDKDYSVNEEALKEECSFSFQTINNKKRIFALDGNSDILPVNGGQMIKGYKLNDEEQLDLSFNIYKLKSSKDYCNGLSFLYHYREQGQFIEEILNTIEYTEVTSFDGELIEIEDGIYDYIPLAENLSSGFYLVEYDNDKERDYQVIQVTDYEGYTALFAEQLFLWVIDTNKHQPLNGVTVTMEGENLGVTDSEGVLTAKLPTLQDEQDYFINVQDDHGHEMIIDILNYDQPDPDSYIDRKYDSFIYTDRKMYLPTDTINVFGYFQNKEGKALNDPKIKLLYWDTVLDEQTIDITKNGTFTCQFDIEDMRYGYVKLVLYEDDSSIETISVNVAMFEKPTFNMNVDIHEDYIMLGDSIHVEANTSYFEGTPIPDATIQMSTWHTFDTGEQKRDLDCDEKGKAETIITPNIVTDSWRPLYYTLNFTNLDLQKYYTNYQDSVILFPRDIMVECEAEYLSDHDISFSMQANAINLTNFDGQLYDRDSYKGDPIGGLEAKVIITEKYYERQYIGQCYNPILKVTYDRYNYIKRSNIIGTLEVKTNEEGEYTFTYPAAKEGRSYSFELSTYDRDGRHIKDEIWASEQVASYKTEENEILEPYSLSINTDESKYKMEDEVEAWVAYNGKKIEDNEVNMTMFLTCREGILDYSYEQGTSTHFKFHNDYIPNAYVMALFYDGHFLYQPWNDYIFYDTTDEELNIEIHTDKVDYKPGESVDIDLKVTDHDNQPVNSDINISVVDEAYFALRGDYFEPLDQLYRYIYDKGIISERLITKYPPNQWGCGAEKGGGGDDGYLRSDFKNTAYFETITTNNQGEGKVSFKLPDNLTSWRITATATTQDKKAGKTMQDVNCKLPYFIDTILYDEYMAGDKIYIGLKTAGTKVTEEMDISYTVILENDLGEQFKSELESKGNVYAYASLGQPEAGSYTVTVTSKAEDYRDAVEYTFNVIDGSLHYFELIDSQVLTEKMDFVTNNNPVTLTFLNNEEARHHRRLMEIYNLRHSSRIDHKAAAYSAGHYLNERYEIDLDLDFIKDYEDFIRKDIFSDMTYGSASPYVTATILLSDLKEQLIENPEIRDRMVAMLNHEKSNEFLDSKEQYASLWALALLDEPVLLDIYEAMKTDLATSDTLNYEKIFLLQALIDMGDLEQAKKLYNQIKLDHSQLEDGELYFQGDQPRNYTALIMLAAVELGFDEDADKMYNYLEGESDQYNPTQIQQLYYLISREPEHSVCSFNYKLDGEEKEVNLEYRDTLRLTLLPEEAENITFADIKGNISVISEFIGTAENVISSEHLSVKRTYRVNGKPIAEEQINIGDKVQVVIEVTSDMNLRSLEINDILPAGFAYFNQKVDSSHHAYYHNQGKRVDIRAYVRDENIKTTTVTYYALAVTKGTYTADNVVVKRCVGNEMAIDEKKTLEIH